MKTIKLFLALVLINISVKSQTFNLDSISFSNGDFINKGSVQWIQISNVNPQSKIKIIIAHPDSSIGNFNEIDTLLNVDFLEYSDTSTIDSNGVLKVYFTMPINYLYNTFFIFVNANTINYQYAYFYNLASITELSQSYIMQKYTYTNLLGQSTSELKGLLIRSDKKLIYFE